MNKQERLANRSRTYTFHERVSKGEDDHIRTLLHYNDEMISMLGQELAVRMKEVMRLKGEIQGIRQDSLRLNTLLEEGQNQRLHDSSSHNG
jgi:hypothetical protein